MYTPRTVHAHGWTRWLRPVMRGYLVRCCDCGLTHEFQFRITQRGRVHFRARRKWHLTRLARREIGAPCFTAADAIDLTGAATDVGAAKKIIGLIYNGTDWMQIYESDN